MPTPIPTVSVLIATCNRPIMVGRAIKSVLNQTYQDFEIIIVDDGQQERAEHIVKSFADKRISYIQHFESRGCAGSRVTGIKASRAEYVAYLDDDDVWEPEKLETQISCLRSASADVGFSFTAVTMIFDTRTDITHVPDGIDDYYEAALARFDGFLSVTLMFKREVFESVGLPDPTFPSHTDIEFILRVSKKFQGLGIDKPLTRVNMKHDHAQMGTDFTNRIRGREMLLAKYKVEFEQRPALLAAHLTKLAWFYRSDKRYKEARGVYRQALALNFSAWRLFHYLSMLENGFGYRLFRTVKSLLGKE